MKEDIMSQFKYEGLSKSLHKAEQGKRVTLDDLAYDLNNDKTYGYGTSALWVADQDQIDKLVDSDRVDEAWAQRFYNVQEELRNEYKEFA